jgi:hypothetical protein
MVEFFSTGMGFAPPVDGDPRMRADAVQSAERFYWTNAAVWDTVTWAKAAVGASQPSDRKSSTRPVSMTMLPSMTFCGRTFGTDELELMRQIAANFSPLGVTEIARTICELLEWRRPSGRLKDHECRQMLEQLQARNFLQLPALRKLGGKGPRRPDLSKPCAEPTIVEGDVSEYAPLELVLVEEEAESRRWREQVERYHYLGCCVPFGANLRYWVRHGDRELACLLWTSPAWRMRARDTWIGWSDTQRQRNLQQIVNNGRFVILPGVRIKGLASKVLALSARQIGRDWEKHYGCRPVLLETLVEGTRFRGTCYRAANWIRVGKTTGRGRTDGEHKAHGQAIKDIYVYPLVHDARERLCSDAASTQGNAPHAELMEPHALFARLVWHQVRHREHFASDAGQRRGSPPSSGTWEAARSTARRDVALPIPVPASVETVFTALVRRRLDSPVVREGS